MKSTINEFGSKFINNLRAHWLRYCALIVTGSLTFLAAWNLTQNVLYGVALLALAEGASQYWIGRVEQWENWVQAVAAGAGTLLSILAIATTDLASATIIARLANLQIFTAFSQVPVWAQNTVVYVVPVLAVLHVVLATVYHFFSESASTLRAIAKSKREAMLAIERAKAQAKVDIAIAHAKRYEELAQTHSQNEGYLRAEKEWQETASTDTGTPYRAETVNADPTKAPSRK